LTKLDFFAIQEKLVHVANAAPDVRERVPSLRRRRPSTSQSNYSTDGRGTKVCRGVYLSCVSSAQYCQCRAALLSLAACPQSIPKLISHRKALPCLIPLLTAFDRHGINHSTYPSTGWHPPPGLTRSLPLQLVATGTLPMHYSVCQTNPARIPLLPPKRWPILSASRNKLQQASHRRQTRAILRQSPQRSFLLPGTVHSS
jgi:hypothetical protein